MNDALFIIDPGADIYESSTFASNSFKITNLSTTGQNITSIVLDLSTAIFPDLVYDPEGKAGDSASKGFEIDLDPSSVAGTSGVKSFEYLKPRDGGYDALQINFSDFKPSQTLEFSIDTDPTSTKGAEQDNSKHYGSISGLELVGAIATVTFADGEVLTGQFYRIPDSDTGSQAALAVDSNLISAPTIEAVGLESQALVNKASQTIKVTGTPGSQVSLLIVDGALFIEGQGHDIDPFEANTALAVNELTATIGANGTVEVPVTLTRTATENGTGGLNYIVAKYQDSANTASKISTPLVLNFDPAASQPGDIPTAVLDAPELTQLDKPYTFNVTYTDNLGIDTNTINADDVKVTAPDGSVLPATFKTVVDTKGDGTVVTATYSVAAPGGTWNQRGAYKVEINAGKVSDTAGNKVAAGELGSFLLNIPHSASAKGVIRIEAEDYRAGENAVDYYDSSDSITQPDQPNFGGVYRLNEPVDIEVTGDVGGGFNVGYVTAGETLTYDVVIPKAENYNLVLRVANPDTFDKTIDATIDGKTYTASISSTGDYQVYQDIIINNVNLSAGTKELSLNFQSKDYNINYVELVPAAPVVDTTAPTAKLNTTTLTQQSNTTTAASFTVTFADNSGIDAATIDANDLTVTAPDGIALPVTLVSVDASGNGTPRTATYSVAAPGGTWDTADKGTYTVAVKAGQVSDINGNKVAASVLGNLNIDIASVQPPVTEPPTNQPSEDITIRIEAEDYKAGVNGDKYLDTSRNNFGGAYRQDNVDLEATKDVVGGGYNVAWIEAGEFLTYDLNIPAQGNYDLVLRVATPAKDTKKVNVVIGGKTYTASFSNTGGWQTYRDVVINNVNLDAGTKELRLDMKSGGFNFNYLELRSQQSTTEPPVTEPPVTEPPVTEPPVTEPPVTEPPTFEPPVNEPSPETGIIRIEAENYKPGTNGVEFYDAEAENFGGAYRPNEPVDIEATGDIGGGFNVGYIVAGETLAYDVVIPKAENYNLVLRVANPDTLNKTIDATIDGKTYTANVGSTGDYQVYQDVVINNVNLTAGTKELTLKFQSKDYNINYVELRPAEPVVDSILPSATLDNTPDDSDIVTLNQLSASKTAASFSVTYADNLGIDPTSIDATDITVTAPNGKVVPVTLAGTNNGNGKSHTAMYSIAAPGGTWDAADIGDYTVAIKAGAVSDLNGNATPAKNIGKLALNVLTPTSDGVTRINAGASSDAVDSFGKLWKADVNFTGGTANAPIYNPIDNTKDDFIYQSQRSGANFSYSVPIANGNYNVSLYLSELSFTDFSQRVFDVALEGQEALDNVDIYKLTNNAFLDGKNDANIVKIPNLAIVRDGALDLNFTSVVGDAALAGIEITPINGAQVLIEESGQNTSVAEGGNTDTYQVLLNTKPTANVTVNLQLDGQTTVDKNSLVFTPQNWSTPQTVTVSAVDDSAGESFHTSIIGHTITTTDPNYGSLSVPSVSAKITDNDSVAIKFKPQQEIDQIDDGYYGTTAAAWGPDGRLYVALASGLIKAYTLDDNYNVLNSQEIDVVKSLSNPNITGIAFNPFENDGSQPKLYIAHNQFYANPDAYADGLNELTDFSPYSGQVSVLEGPDFNKLTPLVQNIGVSNHDHGVNGLAFDANGDLLITSGSNTNAGIADKSIGGIDESPFTAGILKAEITKPNFNGNIQYKMPDGWVAPEGLNLTKPDGTPAKPEESQGFGGIVEVVPGVDVSVYAPGLRNSYDLVYATNGIIYATENDANTSFGDESISATEQRPFVLDPLNELNIIEEGNYYGQPNRNRGKTDDRQNTYYPSYAPSDANHTAPIEEFDRPVQGIVEYRSSAFGGQLQGNLLTQVFNGPLHIVRLSEDGSQSANNSLLEVEVVDDVSGAIIKTSPFYTKKYNSQDNKNEYNDKGLDVLTGPGGAIIGLNESDSRVAVIVPDDDLITNMVAYDISDWRAPASGGGQFTIGGINFSGKLADTTVEIGGKAATITSVTEKRIVGVFPSFGATDLIINSTEYTEDNLLDISVASAGEISIISNAYQPLFI